MPTPIDDLPSTPILDSAESGGTEAKPKGWHAIDLDGTLAHCDGWKGPEHIGAPIGVMVDRVKSLIAAGWTVKIMTARAADPSAHAIVQAWLLAAGLPVLEVTDRKDFNTVQIWDDRAVAVQANTGITHFDMFRFMREGLETLARGLGILPERNRNYDMTLKRVIEQLGEIEAAVAGGLDSLSNLRGDQFKGGYASQALKDVCAARSPLRNAIKHLAAFKKPSNQKESV